MLDFYEKGLNQKDFEAAAKHFGPKYIQHNPTAPDGIEGFKAFIAFRKDKFPNAKSEIKRAFAEGDYLAAELMAEGHRWGAGKFTVEEMPIGATDATGLDADQKVIWPGLRLLHLPREKLARRLQSHCLHVPLLPKRLMGRDLHVGGGLPSGPDV